MNQSKSKPKKSFVTLPISQVSTIMRSSPEVTNVSPDAIQLAARAAELFIAQLAKDAHNQSKDSSRLDYNDISNVVASHPRMNFLQDVVPKKIKVKEYIQYREIIEKLEHEAGKRSDDHVRSSGGDEVSSIEDEDDDNSSECEDESEEDSEEDSEDMDEGDKIEHRE